MVARLRANREAGLPPASFAYPTAAADHGYAARRIVQPEVRVECRSCGPRAPDPPPSHVSWETPGDAPRSTDGCWPHTTGPAPMPRPRDLPSNVGAGAERSVHGSPLFGFPPRPFLTHHQATVDREYLARQRGGVLPDEHRHHGCGVVGGERPGQRLERRDSSNSAVGTTPLAEVRVSPGATAVTAIPWPPSPTARAWVMPVNAPLGAAYASMCAPGGRQNVLDTMKTTLPKAWVSSSADSTFTAWT